MDIIEFFARRWYRNELLQELGLPDDSSWGFNPLTTKLSSFDTLRFLVAIKHLGKEAYSREFRIRWLEDKISMLRRVRERDRANYQSMDKDRQARSAIPGAIANTSLEIIELENELIKLKK